MSSPTPHASWRTSRLTIRGDDHLAASLFARSLDAARRLGDPFVLARTLLMAGWVPFWRQRLDEAEALFREALDVIRAGRAPRRVGRGARARRARERDVAPRRRGRRACARARGARDRRGVGAAVLRGDRPSGGGRLLAAAAAARGCDRARRRGGADPARAGRTVGAGQRARRSGRDASRGGQARRGGARSSRGVRALPRSEGAGARHLDGRGARPDPRRHRGMSRAPARCSPIRWHASPRVSPGERACSRSRTRWRRWPRATRWGHGTVRSRRSPSSPRRRCSPIRRRRPCGGSARLFGPEAAGGDGRIDEARDTLERNGWRQALREPELVQPR